MPAGLHPLNRRHERSDGLRLADLAALRNGCDVERSGNVIENRDANSLHTMLLRPLLHRAIQLIGTSPSQLRRHAAENAQPETAKHNGRCFKEGRLR
jgi:hypothetical protein